MFGPSQESLNNRSSLNIWAHNCHDGPEEADSGTSAVQIMLEAHAFLSEDETGPNRVPAEYAGLGERWHYWRRSAPPAAWSMCSYSPAAASPGSEERLRSGAGFPGSLRLRLKIFSVETQCHTFKFTFTFMHLADAFIQTTYNCIQVIHFH